MLRESRYGHWYSNESDHIVTDLKKDFTPDFIVRAQFNVSVGGLVLSPHCLPYSVSIVKIFNLQFQQSRMQESGLVYWYILST